MIEVLCRCPAVLTRAGVPSEDRAPVDRHPVVAWDLHVADQTDDRRFGDADPLRPKHPLGGMDQLCSGVEDQEQCTTSRHDAERFVGCIQDQCPPHGR